MKFISFLLVLFVFAGSAFAQQKDSVINKKPGISVTFLAGPFFPISDEISLSGGGIGAEFEFPFAPKASFMASAILNAAPERGNFDHLVLLPHISIGPRWYMGNPGRKFFIETGLGLIGIANLRNREGGGGISIHLGLGYSHSLSSSSRIIVKAKTHGAVVGVKGGHPGIGGIAFTELHIGYGIDF